MYINFTFLEFIICFAVISISFQLNIYMTFRSFTDFLVVSPILRPKTGIWGERRSQFLIFSILTPAAPQPTDPSDIIHQHRSCWFPIEALSFLKHPLKVYVALDAFMLLFLWVVTHFFHQILGNISLYFFLFFAKLSLSVLLSFMTMSIWNQ